MMIQMPLFSSTPAALYADDDAERLRHAMPIDADAITLCSTPPLIFAD